LGGHEYDIKRGTEEVLD